MKRLTSVDEGYESEVLRADVPSLDVADAMYVMPYVKSVTNTKEILMVNKKAWPLRVKLDGVSGGLASVVEVSGSEPGFNPPVVRTIAADGGFQLGPFAVA